MLVYRGLPPRLVIGVAYTLHLGLNLARPGVRCLPVSRRLHLNQHLVRRAPADLWEPLDSARAVDSAEATYGAGRGGGREEGWRGAAREQRTMPDGCVEDLRVRRTGHLGLTRSPVL